MSKPIAVGAWSIALNDARERWEVRQDGFVYDWADSQIAAIHIVRDLFKSYTADADRAQDEADLAQSQADEMRAAANQLDELLKKELGHDR